MGRRDAEHVLEAKWRVLGAQLCHFSYKRLQEKWHNSSSTARFLYKTATIWGSTPGRPQVVLPCFVEESCSTVPVVPLFL